MRADEIIATWLRDNGYDGLFDYSAECGCAVDDLAPCGEIRPFCEAGYSYPCDGNCDLPPCDGHIGPRRS